MGFSRQEYWTGLLFPSPGNLPDPGIKPVSPVLQADLYQLSYKGSPCSVVSCIKSICIIFQALQMPNNMYFSSVQSLSHIWLFVTPWFAARQASLSITNSWSSLKLMSIKLVMHPAISSSVVPFSSCLQSFPASGSFPMSQFFASGGQSIGASASVLPMNVQDWFPLGWAGWISLQSKGLSRVFSWELSTPQFKNINSSALSFLHNPTLTSIHDYWKDHRCDYTDLCR